MVDNRAITSTKEDVKQLYRSLYTLVKQLDEKKQSITNIKQIFAKDLHEIRLQIIDQSENLLFQNHDVIGKKSREVLWRKGYYELISLAKYFWPKTDEKPMDDLAELIIEGITKFKAIIVRIEEENASDDLRNLIDFSILDASNGRAVKKYLDWDQDCSNGDMNYVKETMHASLLSIGDLHRYYIDFNFTKSKFTKEFAAKYYLEAFNLNPTIGMAQNQLGTLFSGQNYDLDSTYHYLYSLICSKPFELSENNVSKIFLNSSTYIGKLEEGKSSDSLRDFSARFILIADIFFFDKDVTDFTSLCHSWLLDLKMIFQSKRCKLTKDMLYKIVMTLFFCMTKLKAIDSPKFYSLIALMVAICSELVDVCIINMEKFIEQRKSQDEHFQETYKMLFDLFQKDVRRSRDIHKLKIQSQPQALKEPEDQHPTLLKKSTTTSTKDFIENGSQMSTVNEMVPSAGSSGREKESDGKSSTTSKLKKKQLTRRRRKKINSDDSEESDLTSDFDSDYEMDSNFSSDDDNDDDDILLSSCCSTDCENDDTNGLTDDEDAIIECIEKVDKFKGQSNGFYADDSKVQPTRISSFISPTADMLAEVVKSDFDKLNFDLMDDDADIVIEEECMVFTQCPERNSPIISLGITYSMSNPADPSSNQITTDSYGSDHQSDQKFEKLRYKREYSKIDPNIVIEFAQYEPCVVTLKILFDWLKVNNEILLNCYSSNPEFIHKIMKLLNLFNIHVFTKKVYFERNLIKTQNVRNDLRSLFDNRVMIPLHEDVLLKDFQLLKLAQHKLDWTASNKLNITENEENILRVLKLADFGFFMTKMKKFRYNFCVRTMRFIEVLTRKERGGRKNSRGNNELNNNNNRRNRGGRGGRRNRRNRNGIMMPLTTSNDEKDVNESKVIMPKKSYLKNRNIKQLSDKENSGEESKYQIMGKLWLRNEVKTLETMIKKGPINKFTPYLILDSKSLTEHLPIVKSLIQSKKFVLLVPSTVICELDELKKCGESARNTIRFLEQQFSKGSRFIRAQRNNESLVIPLIKIPKKLDRDSATFVQIAQFCNFIQTTHSENNIKMVTLLTGENLHAKKSSNISFTGILNAVSVDFEQITAFHAKYKKK